MSEPFVIGMIGCGTVGGGVLQLLRRQGENFARIAGRPLKVARIVVRRPDRPRRHLAELLDPEVEFSSDTRRVTRDPGIDLVVEVAGGTDEPRQWILDALEHGRDVVTANKAVLAFHGAEIFRTARQKGRKVYYEASVAAAIPIIEMLENSLVANQVTRIEAILNGTCNYILTRMEQDHMDYAEALSLAQEKGFAEADPTLDVMGGDTAHKLAVIAGIITRSAIPLEKIYTEGIDRITLEDVEFARSFHYRIKMLAILKRNETGALDLRVHPTLIRQDQILAQVHNEFNAIYLQGDAVGEMLVHGKGAGALPTASSVVADIVRAASLGRRPTAFRDLPPPELVPIEKVELRNYIRVTVLDLPGVLGRITSQFGMRQISISSIHQPEAKTGHPVPIVFVTHETPDDVLSETLKNLEEVKLIRRPATRIRIEE